MSRRSQRPSPKPADPKPRTLADLAKLPRDERLAALRIEEAAILKVIDDVSLDLAHVRGMIALTEASEG